MAMPHSISHQSSNSSNSLISTIQMAEITKPSTVRVAPVQTETCYFNLEGAVEKTCHLITEPAEKGCDKIAFREVWIPMYPGWI